jgi:hypothetical protein
MAEQRVFEWNEQKDANLYVDAIYKGGSENDWRAEPLAKNLLPLGTAGGFRPKNDENGKLCMVGLLSSLNHPDWPDRLDKETGLFVYYGDNRKGGLDLHKTPRGGNALLRDIYSKINTRAGRNEVPPFFVFTPGSSGRDRIFRGLAAPGFPMLNPTEQLVTIWKITKGIRFPNYKAAFTILNEPCINREYIDALLEGQNTEKLIPKAWKKWVESGTYDRLIAEPTIAYRTQNEQLPDPISKDMQILNIIYDYFKDCDRGFEHMAKRVVELMDKGYQDIDLTQYGPDGGRDAVGKYTLGHIGDSIKLTFAVEAKCWDPNGSGVGFKETSRLISRLRHREFGIFVTTSYLRKNAYEEIRDDMHPVIVIAGLDLVRILGESGYTTAEDVHKWLLVNFPKPDVCR